MHALALGVFFASGFAALLYQVAWQRLLATFSGVDVYSVTIIVAAFMAGLGCGNLAGGHLADRLSPRNSLGLFAAAEVAVGAFGLLSKTLYYDLLYRQFGHLATSPGPMAVVLFLSLLWPTFFMGLSLPLLARALTQTIDGAARTVAALYGWNTLGAAVGALATTWLLLPQWGLHGGLQAGAVVSLGCAAAAVPLAMAVGRRDRRTIRASALAVGDARPEHSPDAAPADRRIFARWAAIYGLAGFIALSLEIVWFRLLGVMLKSTAFTFGTLLGVYLAGLGLGAAAGSLTVTRSRRPAATFLGIQAAIGLYAGAAVTAVVAAVGHPPRLAWLADYFGRYEPLDVFNAVSTIRTSLDALLWGTPRLAELPWDFLGLYVALPVALIGPPTVLMGLSFPYLQKVVHTDLATLGRRVGLLMLANIAGSLLGTIVTGWMFLGLLGTGGTLRLLVGFSGVFAVLWIRAVSAGTGARRRRTRIGMAAAAVAVVIAVALAVPPAPILWARLHGSVASQVLFAEDGSGLAVLRSQGLSFRSVRVFANGVGQSWIPYGEIHTVLGSLPAFIHPAPRRAAVIGLGSGNTCFSVGGRPGIERISCIEIVGAQLETLRQLVALVPDQGVMSLLGDGRIEHIVADGRAYVRHADEPYDIIEADALRPRGPYAGNVYSNGYFQLVRDRLAPHGLAVTWSPTDRVHDTFVTVFPHVLSFGAVTIGSNQPIPFDPAIVRARLSDPRVVEYYAGVGIDIQSLLAPLLDGPVRRIGPEDDRSGLTDINTDLFPKDEFALPSPFSWSMLRRPGSR